MKESPTYYAKRLQDLQENQKKIYEDWLDSQHQIFQRYMREFENMIKSLQKESKKKSSKSKTSTRKAKRSKRRRR